MTRRILSDDVVATRGNLEIMLVGSGTDLNAPFPMIGERGKPPDAVAYPFGIIVKVIDGVDGPLRVRIVLADRGDRSREQPPTLVVDWEMSPTARLCIGKDESDTGWTVLQPSLPNGAPLEICVTVLERTAVSKSLGTVDMPSAIEVQVGDSAPAVLEHKSDDKGHWRDLIEPDA